jgi:hypothetical protein
MHEIAILGSTKERNGAVVVMVELASIEPLTMIIQPRCISFFFLS